MRRAVARRGVAYRRGDAVPLSPAGRAGDPDHRAEPVTIAPVTAKPDGEVVIVPRRSVAEDGRLLTDSRDHHVHAAVAVEIAEGCSAMTGGLLQPRSRAGSDVFESAVAYIGQDQ